ncbi:TPA: hypothetical protein N0F65_010730 [Lagenidium giganteum]|uniref:DNA endonuclease activator Ctp1 C-terminal domain-containing protein n=1 Tax=Lagenidium giganteum TaxID=4803 RepID=A0AAV2YMR8_9STRA|nr:TPA: hypothetical protein N0F65_010730 [Lagenidium giganteum]
MTQQAANAEKAMPQTAEAWKEEREKLLKIIKTQQQDAEKLAQRFKLLQKTLAEQQQVLDQYQQRLLQSDARVASPKASKASSAASVPSPQRKRTPHSSCAERNGRRGAVPDLDSPPPRVAKRPLAVVRDRDSNAADAPQTWKRIKAARASWPLSSKHALPDAAMQGNSTWMPRKQEWANSPVKATKSTDSWATNAVQDSAYSNVGSAAHQTTAAPLDGKENAFKFVEVVRNRAQRAALPAHDCIECRKYYDALDGLVSDADQQRTKCSRHRARFEPYNTPDDFWRLSFPDSPSDGEQSSL